MQVNVDYKFRDDLVKTPQDTVPIELLESIFKGVVVSFDRVEIKEEETQARVKFEYTIHEKLDFDEAKLRKDQTFNRHLGLVLNSMILELTEADGNRQTNSEEPTEGADVHSQGNSVSQA